MTLYEWIKLYNKKTGEYPNGYPGSEFIFHEEHGFCVFIKDNDVLIVGEVCGDGRYWLKYLIQKAKQLSCTKLRAATKRNPTAYSRFFGAKMVGFSDGNYIFEKEV